MHKLSNALLFSFFILILSFSNVSAHVTVSPSEAVPGSRVNFAVSVPVEKDISTTGLRLVIPVELESVTPNVKAGWKIEIKKVDDKVNEIIWTGGEIQKGLRDEFIFRAKLPTSEMTLNWKAYQTYADGTVVAWDIDPKDADDSHDANTFSQTRVVATKVEDKQEKQPENNFNIVVAFAAASFLMSLFAVYKSLNK